MNRIKRENLNIRKAARFSMIINGLQVGAMTVVLAYALLNPNSQERYFEIGALVLAFLIVTWGAIMDIREARNAERIARQAQMLEEAYAQLESLNGTLRKQRHDFMNHLQVVFSLIELGDAHEAMQYVQSVYGDIKKAGSALKTAIPAVNALIAAKRQDCEDKGIELKTVIASAWETMPIPGWEMCRILGNLIDNARDAILEDKSLKSPGIELTIDESPGVFGFQVSNNGPAIPPQLRQKIFQQGFTTKSDGHGSGLSIVSEILQQYGGTIRLESDDQATRFIGTIPRKSVEAE